MGYKHISDETTQTTLASTDLFVFDRPGTPYTTNKISATNVSSYITSSFLSTLTSNAVCYTSSGSLIKADSTKLAYSESTGIATFYLNTFILSSTSAVPVLIINANSSSSAAVTASFTGGSAVTQGVSIRIENAAASGGLTWFLRQGLVASEFALAQQSTPAITSNNYAFRVLRSGTPFYWAFNNTAPSTSVQMLLTASVNIAMQLTSALTDYTRLKITNTGTGGRDYSISSSASGASEGSGKFIIRDETLGSAVILVDSSQRIMLPGKIYTNTATASDIPFYASSIHVPVVNSASLNNLTLSDWNNGTSGPILNMAKSRGGSIGTYGAVVNGDIVGTIQFLVANNGGNDVGAQISATVNGSVSLSTVPTDIVFYTRQNTTQTEKFRIYGDGRLIGKTTNSYVYQGYSSNSSSSTGGAILWIANDDGAAVASGDRIASMFFGGSYNGAAGVSQSAAITTYAAENFSASVNGTKMQFEITPTGTLTRSTLLNLLANKAVTIGTTNALYQGTSGAGSAVCSFKVADLQGAGTGTFGYDFNSAGNHVGANFIMTNTSGEPIRVAAIVGSAPATTAGAETGNMIFYTKPSTSAITISAVMESAYTIFYKNVFVDSGFVLGFSGVTPGVYSMHYKNDGARFPIRCTGADDGATHRYWEWGYYTSDNISGTWNPKILLDTYTGDFRPYNNKSSNLGATTQRWNNIYYVTATTGTSRLAPAKSTCNNCTEPMWRGTGTTVTLGEVADYIPVFCTNCGNCQMEALSHLPEQELLKRKAPPEINFNGIVVHPYSGNSRGIQVLFDYGLNSDGEVIQNSTYLSDVEYESFQNMTEEQQISFIQDLGLREWNALEEVELMLTETKKLQSSFDAFNQRNIIKKTIKTKTEGSDLKFRTFDEMTNINTTPIH